MLKDNLKPQKALCPRCDQPMSKYPALSRTDNQTHVCELCGMDEAIECHIKGSCSPQTMWVVKYSAAQYLMPEITRPN